jgi:hypothetical protein
MVKEKINNRVGTKYYNYDGKEKYTCIFNIPDDAPFDYRDDFTILQNDKTKKYKFGMECGYYSAGEYKKQYSYINHIYNKMKKWMNENNYDTKKGINFWLLFNGLTKANCTTEFDDIPTLFSFFETYVKGFKNNIKYEKVKNENKK